MNQELKDNLNNQSLKLQNLSKCLNENVKHFDKFNEKGKVIRKILTSISEDVNLLEQKLDNVKNMILNIETIIKDTT